MQYIVIKKPTKESLASQQTGQADTWQALITCLVIFLSLTVSAVGDISRSSCLSGLLSKDAEEEEEEVPPPPATSTQTSSHAMETWQQTGRGHPWRFFLIQKSLKRTESNSLAHPTQTLQAHCSWQRWSKHWKSIEASSWKMDHSANYAEWFR